MAQTQYFAGLETVGQVKAEYRKLAKVNHPDLSSDPNATAKMQEINGQYHAVLAAMDRQISIGSDGKEHTYYYKQEIEQELIDKISEVLKVRMVGVEVELIGTWLWVYGDPDQEATRKYSESLKAMGLQWHGKRSKWYFRRKSYRRKYNERVSFNQMRRMYGSQKFEQEQQGALGAGA